ncbi:serine hydrolase domain-containing protein [Aspergillus lucknowensis]|uniref:Beta-lactamase/transpeptidase-like protein n=1 Tax=Aspergillus lucknowensis TaxID=176173 RepID=A0ABR4LWZ1_9EURO
MQVLSFVALASFFAAASAQIPTAPDLTPDPNYKGCPPDGPLLPRPTDLANSKYVQEAGKKLSHLLDSAVNGEIEAGWIRENVSFSLALVSPYGPGGVEDNVKPFWEYHHRAKNNEQGVTEVDGDTQFLVGSVSKVFSDLMLLRSGVDLRSPVTDFLPELRSPKSKIPWEEVTLEMLADHLAGVPPNVFYEFYFLNSFHESLGLPHLKDSEFPQCGVLGLNGACTKEQIIEAILSKDPVVPLNAKPIYSQLSFTLYTLCLEAHTGKNYSQLLDETIYSPFNLLNSGVSPGDTEKAAVPPGVSSWGSDYGFNAPGGGLYSTANDLSAFLSSILNYSILDTPADVRKWLKPRSTTSSLNTLVGRPWEILRTTDLLPPKHEHTVDIYGKSGGAMGYMAQIAVVDQYGVGVAVLTAGPVDSMDIIYRAVLGTFFPAIEEEARFQARGHAGTWTSKPANRTHGDEKIKLTLKLEDDNTGLKLSSYTRGNSSMIEAIQTYWYAEYLPLGFGILPDELRVYPTDLEIPIPASEAYALLAGSHHPGHRQRSDGEHEDVQLVRQEWRISLDIVPLGGAQMSDLPGQHVATNYCGSWQTVDWMTYGGISLDKLVFIVDKNTGNVIGVEAPALRGGLLTR